MKCLRWVLKTTVLASVAALLSSCTLITLQNPFANVHKLGTILGPDESITMPLIGTGETMRIEYVAPTRRRIVLGKEEREFSLWKSSALNGIYVERKFREKLGGKFVGISYVEATGNWKSEEDLQLYIARYESMGFEHREKEQLITRAIAGTRQGGKPYILIGIDRYRLIE